mgnify:CR=1 FL=1
MWKSARIKFFTAKELKGFSQENATKELKGFSQEIHSKGVKSFSQVNVAKPLSWKSLVGFSHDKLKNELLNPIL